MPLYYSNRQIYDLLLPANLSCYPDYSQFNEEKSNYATFINLTTSLNASFQYSQTTDFSYLTNYDSYLNSGGYLYLMNSDLNTTLNDLTNLQLLNWIDKNTREILFELTLYNPNINLFCSVKILFEILPNGIVLPTLTFDSVQFWSQSRQILAITCIALFISVVAVLILREVKSILILKSKKIYFIQYWIYIDWLMYLFAIVSLPLFLYKIYALQNIENFVAKNSISYINLSTLSFWNKCLGFTLAICSFLITIKMIKLLRFNKQICYLLMAIHKCSNELISFFLIYFILLFSFTQLMFLFYNESNSEYKTFIHALATNFRILLGHFDFSSLLKMNYILGALIFSAYIALFAITMFSILVVILTRNLKQTRLEKLKINPFNPFDHFYKRFIKPKMNKTNKIILEDVVIVEKDNIDEFEKATKKLIDRLKEHILIGKSEFSQN